MRKKLNLKELLHEPSNDLEIFHEKTKMKKALPFPDAKEWPKSWKTVYFKEYPRLDKIILPEPTSLNNVSLEDTLMNRQSKRVFTKTEMSLEQISTFLYYSSGLKTNSHPWLANRFYPSPGARYALETYVITLNTEIPKGVYHYNLRSHSLEILLQNKFSYQKYTANVQWIKNANILVVITAIFKRNTIKYGIRGYRHVLEEAGHLGQNFYLIGNALDMNTCAIAGYLDDKLNKLLDVDGLNETVIYVLAAGPKP